MHVPIPNYGKYIKVLIITVMHKCKPQYASNRYIILVTTSWAKQVAMPARTEGRGSNSTSWWEGQHLEGGPCRSLGAILEMTNPALSTVLC